jgi:hypothetical protein
MLNFNNMPFTSSRNFLASPDVVAGASATGALTVHAAAAIAAAMKNATPIRANTFRVI